MLIDDRGNQPLFPSVGTTNRAGGEQAARHLLAAGRRRPVVITGIERFGCSQERLAGFTGTFAAEGRPVDPGLIVEGDFTFDSGRLAVERLLVAGVEFDAVFAHNDLSAVGAMQALRDAGRTVPQDVSVVGFDDIPLAAHSDPPLTTIHQPMREMGQAAARMLLSHFDGVPLPDVPEVIVTRLVVRGSSTPVRGQAVPVPAAAPVPTLAAP